MRVLRTMPGVDLVILDVVMPDVDGLELIPMLRDAARNAALVFVSGEDWTLDIGAEIARGHGLSVLGTISKPVTPKKLQPLIDGYLQLRVAARGSVS